MRSSNLLLAFTYLALLGQAVPPAFESASFLLVTFNGDQPYQFLVHTKKSLDAATVAEFKDPARWKVYGVKIEGEKKTALNPVSPTKIDGFSSLDFKLHIDKGQFGGGPLGRTTKIAATLVFQSVTHPEWPPLQTEVGIGAPPPLHSTLEPVTVVLDDSGDRDKDTKADIVLSGSMVSAVGSSPTYFYEAKAKYRLGLSNFNVNGSMIGNQGNNVDPDSIKAAFGYAKPVKKLNGRGLFWRNTFNADLVRGEFSRKDQTSNIGSSFFFQSLSKPTAFNPDKTRFAYLQLKGGMEAVKNANKPDSIPALKEYKGGVRPLGGATLTMVLDAEAFGDDEKVPRFTFTGDYQARIPLLKEPFTRVVDEKNVITLSSKTRHSAEVTMLWQATNYWGFFSKYRYGSLPPLFVFTDHQVLIGIAFQAKWK
jgi:hypothetical protein